MDVHPKIAQDFTVLGWVWAGGVPSAKESHPSRLLGVDTPPSVARIC